MFDYPRFASTVFWYNLATWSRAPAPAVADNFLIVLEAQLWSCHWSWTWSLTWTVPPPATWDRTRLNYRQDRWRQHSEQAPVLHFVLHHLVSDLDLRLDGLGEVIWTYKEVFCYIQSITTSKWRLKVAISYNWFSNSYELSSTSVDCHWWVLAIINEC